MSEELMSRLDCKNLNIGDYVVIEYSTGEKMKGGRITGKVKEIKLSYGQVQLESGWCAHNGDIVVEHKTNVR